MRCQRFSAVLACAALLLGCLAVAPIANGLGETVASNSGAELSGDYAEALEAALAFAAEFAGVGEADLLALPGVQLDGESTESRPVITRTDSDRAEYRFVVERKTNAVVAASRTLPDKSAIHVYMDNGGEGRPFEALVTRKGGNRHVEFSFADGSTVPKLAIGLAGKKWPLMKVSGDVVLWDDEGNIVRTLHAPRPENLPDFLKRSYAELEFDEIERFGLDYRTRFDASKAAGTVDPLVREGMRDVLATAYRFKDIRPDTARETARGTSQVQLVHDRFDEYEVAVYEYSWRFQFNRENQRLVRAVWTGGLAVYYDADEGFFFGGCVPYGTSLEPLSEAPPQIRLIGFYPGRLAPRLVISCEGELPDALAVSGHVCLWTPEGKVLFEKKDAAAETLADLLREIDAALTPEEKESVAWRGLDELPYLIGTY